MTGFLNIDKAEGVSSAREVAICKRLTKTPCGHMGTLDPMASGVLPVAVGNAARLFDYFLQKQKVYEAEFIFGCTSDTLDTTGAIEQAGTIPTAEEIKKALPSFIGKLAQIPPRYSAKNVNGMRGYQLARAGVEFDLPPKEVEVYDFSLLKQTEENKFLFRITCGGGTYIRSLARDLAKSLHTYAIMSALCRTKSGVFTLENAVKTESLTAENVQDFIIPTESVLPFEKILVDKNQSNKLLNGLTVWTDYPDGTYLFYAPDGSFYGLAAVINHILKIRTKLC